LKQALGLFLRRRDSEFGRAEARRYEGKDETTYRPSATENQKSKNKKARRPAES